MTTGTDRIEKTIVLHAPRSRVWKALTDSKQFGTWFGMRFEAPFAAGAVMKGVMTPTTVDAKVAALQKQFEGLAFDITIDRIEPERLFSFRWHPGAVEPGVDYAKEPMTLVEFELAEGRGGVAVTITESGFDAIPLARRAKAFSGNKEGWGMVTVILEKFLAQG